MPVPTENIPANVVVHPLVLLSVVDHYNRMSKVGSKGRVVGLLLGSWKQKGVLDISNSFALPFDEDEKDRDVWFLDHDYLESMFGMYKKVNARERIIGWYHTGPKLHPNDIAINELIRKYAPNSVLVIVNAKPESQELPTAAYRAVEHIHDDGTPTSRTFAYIPSSIGAEEAEEVGVEHLLRDIKDSTVGSLSQRIARQVEGLRGLAGRIAEISDFMNEVIAKKMPMNHEIFYEIQDITNLIPAVGVRNFIDSMLVTTNDQMLILYISAFIQSVVALHNLISNKLANQEAERKEGKKVEEKKTDEKKVDDKKLDEKKDLLLIEDKKDAKDTK